MNIDWIARASALSLSARNLIGGRWNDVGGIAGQKRGPRDGRILYERGSGSPEDADAAVASARRAFEDGRWSLLTSEHRKEALLKLAGMIERHKEELALLEALDTGKPIADALSVDIPVAAQILRYSAEAMDKMQSKVYATDATSLSYQLRQPIGVVAGIVGWNFPLVLAITKLAPALASGNTLVLKPSEMTSLTTGRLGELVTSAGIPEGTVNIVHGDAEVGRALARHGDVDLLTFTGSTRTGKSLMIAAGGSNMKRLILECGGKAPNIVFADAPSLEAVAEAVVARAFWNQGQVCTASSRLLVQESIRPALLELLLRNAAALMPGDPLKAETKFGALVSAAHKQKVMEYIECGRREGATLHQQSGRAPPFPGGYYVAPAVFDNVSPRSRIAQEEIFGPVLAVLSFEDENEAFRIANETLYGLSAVVWTRDFGRGHRATQRIRAGTIAVNATAHPSGGPAEGVMTVGGHKESGFGVEGGLEGLEAYTSQKAVQFFV